jgi:hypothetical protein
MKRFKVRVLSATLVAVMGIMGMAGCGATLDGTKTVATIDGEEVPLGVASFALRYSQAQTDYYYKQLAAMYEGFGIGEQNWDEIQEGETKTTGELTKDDLMNRLKELYEVRKHASDYGVEIAQADKDKIIAAAKEFIANNDTSLLARMGVTESDVVEYLELETYYKEAYEPMLKDKEIIVTDEEAAQSTVTYSFLSTNNLEEETAKKQMEDLLAEYKKEEDIATFDMTAFTDEKDAGFMTTTASFGNEEAEDGTGLDSAVVAAARTLKDGEMYQEVIEGEAGGGYFIVRMDKTKDEEATANKKETIEKEKKQEAFDAMVDEMVEKGNIKVDEKVWSEVKLSNKEKYTIKLPEVPEEEIPVEEVPAEEEEPVEVDPAEEEIPLEVGPEEETAE